MWWPTVTNLGPAAAACDERYAHAYILPALGEVGLDRLDQPMLIDWVTDLDDPETVDLEAPTIHRVARILSRCLAAAVDEGLITNNPAADLPLPDIEENEMNLLTDEEIWRLAHAMHPRYRPSVLLAGFCGLRLGELLGLRWKHVDLAGRRLHIVETMTELDGRLLIGPPKAKARVRSLPLPEFVVSSLARLQDENDGTDGQPATPSCSALRTTARCHPVSFTESTGLPRSTKPASVHCGCATFATVRSRSGFESGSIPNRSLPWEDSPRSLRSSGPTATSTGTRAR